MFWYKRHPIIFVPHLIVSPGLATPQTAISRKAKQSVENRKETTYRRYVCFHLVNTITTQALTQGMYVLKSFKLSKHETLPVRWYSHLVLFDIFNDGVIWVHCDCLAIVSSDNKLYVVFPILGSHEKGWFCRVLNYFNRKVRIFLHLALIVMSCILCPDMSHAQQELFNLLRTVKLRSCHQHTYPLIQSS